MHQEINATVIIKSPYEHESSRGEISAQHARLGDFIPELHTVIETARYFRDAGFKVTPNHNYISIKGSAMQFESMFGIHLQNDADVCSAGDIRIPELLRGILVRVIFSQVCVSHY